MTKNEIEQCELPAHPVHKFSYILRMWPVDECDILNWRASLELPETGKRVGFGSLEQLFAYLINVTESTGDN